jgi:hypothetical protein
VTLRCHLHSVGPLGSATCKKCGQEKDFSYCILCQYSGVAIHKVEIFLSQKGSGYSIRVRACSRILAISVHIVDPVVV